MTVEISSALVLRIMRSVGLGTVSTRPMTAEEEAQTPKNSGLWSPHGVRLAIETGPPQEKCGLLRGRGERITVADFVANVSPTPETAFEIDPAALIAAHRAQRRPKALQLIGYFHTHPTGSPYPSVTDAHWAAPDGKLWLIATRRLARLWRAVPAGQVHGRFNPVEFDLVIGKRVEKGLLDVRHVDYGHQHAVTIEGPGFDNIAG